MTAQHQLIARAQRPHLNQADFVSVVEAAEILNRSLRTIRYWEKAGHMPPRKRFGKQLMYRRADVEELAAMAGGRNA
jgi:DNA-binding transcriptional MerR regulator